MNKEYFEKHKDKLSYLEELRQIGVVNMHGAGAYIARDFGVSKVEAGEVLLFWMKNYDEIMELIGEQK